MRIAAFAPHLAGRMLPGLFTYMPFTKKPRFEGDPWPTFPFSPMWYWMHTTECSSPNHIGSSSTSRIRREPWPDAVEWIEPNSQGCSTQQVLKAKGTRPDATDRAPRTVTSPGVGPMGAGQPADAGPAGRQRELFSVAA